MPQNNGLKQLSSSVTNINNNNSPKMKKYSAPKRKSEQKIVSITEFNSDKSVTTDTSVNEKTTVKGSKNYQENQKSEPIRTLQLDVARRNASERNRVKQVNDGFAELRKRIPEKTAEAFKAKGNGKRSAKLATLQMAIEYIGSLKEVLAKDNENKSILDNTCETNNSSVISMTTTPPADNSQHHLDDRIIIEKSLPDLAAAINGMQYARLPGTSPYQMDNTIYYKSENLQPLRQKESVLPDLNDINREHCLVTFPHSPMDDNTTMFFESNQSYGGVRDDDMLDENQSVSVESIMEAVVWLDQILSDSLDVS